MLKMAGCVQHGRKFLSRIIATLRQFGDNILLADALSRMDTSISKADYVRAAVAQHDLKFVPPVVND